MWVKGMNLIPLTIILLTICIYLRSPGFAVKQFALIRMIRVEPQPFLTNVPSRCNRYTCPRHSILFPTNAQSQMTA